MLFRSNGDKILNPKATKALYEMATMPSDFIKNNMVLGTDRIMSTASNFNRVDNGTVNNDVHLNIALPNVQNTNDFINELQHNKRFEKIVQSMTVGQISGGSSLNKYRF